MESKHAMWKLVTHSQTHQDGGEFRQQIEMIENCTENR